MNIVTREEKKFLINIDEFRNKSHYLDMLMIQDGHNGTDGYIIRSLYFDTVYDDDFFEKLEGVIDAIYNPIRTKLVIDALDRGIKAEGGLYMLVAQAVLASEIFLDKKMNFPARNRIISGISSGIIVVEAKEKSGSLITADMAVDYGREVFALPGRVEDECSAGCNDLIKRNKAHMIEYAEDLIKDMQWESNNHTPRQTQIVELLCDLSETQQRLYELLRDAEEGMHVNQLVMETQLAYNVVVAELVMMELQDVVKSMPGGMWRVKK